MSKDKRQSVNKPALKPLADGDFKGVKMLTSWVRMQNTISLIESIAKAHKDFKGVNMSDNFELENGGVTTRRWLAERAACWGLSTETLEKAGEGSLREFLQFVKDFKSTMQSFDGEIEVKGLPAQMTFGTLIQSAKKALSKFSEDSDEG